jgi:hypothetical protein
VGVSCHVGDTSGSVEISWSWQLCGVQMTTRRATATTDEAHWSRERIGELVVNVHRPGPCTGTSATPKEGVSTPLSTPLAALALGSGATDFAVETVTLTNFVLFTSGVVVVVEFLTGGGATVVVVVVVVTIGAVELRCEGARPCS